MGENVFLCKEELENVEPIWEEETLTSFARGALFLVLRLCLYLQVLPTPPV